MPTDVPTEAELRILASYSRKTPAAAIATVQEVDVDAVWDTIDKWAPNGVDEARQILDLHRPPRKDTTVTPPASVKKPVDLTPISDEDLAAVKPTAPSKKTSPPKVASPAVGNSIEALLTAAEASTDVGANDVARQIRDLVIDLSIILDEEEQKAAEQVEQEREWLAKEIRTHVLQLNVKLAQLETGVDPADVRAWAGERGVDLPNGRVTAKVTLEYLKEGYVR